MPYDILMPQLGLTMTEGSVSSWLKKTGELVQKGEMLFTVETDKVEMEVESPVAGYMGAILLEPKKTVPTGTLIAVIVDKLDEIPALTAGVETVQGEISGVADAAPSIPEAPQSTSEALKSRVAGKDGFPASPRARRLADQLGIDIRELKPARGTRIVEEDVKRFHARQLEDSNRQTTSPTATETDSSRARLVVADRMAKSFQTAPHFYLGAQINATELVKFRESFAAGSDQASIRLAYTDLFVKALAQTLYEQSGVNSYWADGRVVNRKSVDVAFAVQDKQRAANGLAARRPQRGQLCRCGDHRVRLRWTGFLLHRDEHPPAGRASGYRADHGVDLVEWQLRVASARRCRCSRRHQPEGPRRRGACLCGKSCEEFHAVGRTDPRLAHARRTAGLRIDAGYGAGTTSRRTTTPCWQK